mgnify:CR=1 FL=1
MMKQQQKEPVNFPKEKIDEGLALTKHLNYNMDLSFKYKGKKEGKW